MPEQAQWALESERMQIEIERVTLEKERQRIAEERLKNSKTAKKEVGGVNLENEQ